MQISKNENRFYSVEILFSHDLHNFRLGDGGFWTLNLDNTMLKCH